MNAAPSRYATLSRDELATLVPELLLIGQLIDRSGMAWALSAFGQEEMFQIAIEEWAGASPIYTRRMQRALNFVGDDVPTIFKGLQLDIGAPPQFMDFRYTVHDRWNGEFRLDHCGALLDVEPMGDDAVRGMCHDIEDPTFDATAVATNARAQVRPIHRPPRAPADRHPHCAWTVIIDPSYPEVTPLAPFYTMAKTRAATWELAPIERGDPDAGRPDYSGPLLSDVDFAGFSHSALVRIADEVCLQMQLLAQSFWLAMAARAENPDSTRKLCTKGLIGVAGLGAERINRALGLGGGTDGVLETMRLHPVFNPAGYVDADFTGGQVRLRRGPVHDDTGSWASLCGPAAVAPLQAMATAVDPFVEVAVSGSDTDWVLEAARSETRRKESGEVAVIKFSGGSTFAFEGRTSIPLTVV